MERGKGRIPSPPFSNRLGSSSTSRYASSSRSYSPGFLSSRTPTSDGYFGLPPASVDEEVPPTIEVSPKPKDGGRLGFRSGDLLLTPHKRHVVVMGVVERHGTESQRLWVQYVDDSQSKEQQNRIHNDYIYGKRQKIPEFSDLPTGRTRTEDGQELVMAHERGPARGGFLLPARPRVESPRDTYTSAPYCEKWRAEAGMPDELRFGEHHHFKTGKLVHTVVGKLARIKGTAHFGREMPVADEEEDYVPLTMDGSPNARVGMIPGTVWIDSRPVNPVRLGGLKPTKNRKVLLPTSDAELRGLRYRDGTQPRMVLASEALEIMGEMEEAKRARIAAQKAGRDIHTLPSEAGRRLASAQPEPYTDRELHGRAPPQTYTRAGGRQAPANVALQSGFGGAWTPQGEAFRSVIKKAEPPDTPLTLRELARREAHSMADSPRLFVGDPRVGTPGRGAWGGRYSDLPDYLGAHASRGHHTSHGQRPLDLPGSRGGGRGGDGEESGGQVPAGPQVSYRRFGQRGVVGGTDLPLARVRTNPPLKYEGWWP